MGSTVAGMIEEWLDREYRTQRYLAKLAQVAPESITRIMQGHGKPGHHLLRKLNKAMGLPPGTLEAVQAQQRLEINNGAGGQR